MVEKIRVLLEKVELKTYEELEGKFSNDADLFYRDMIVFPNYSIYRCQMKKEDQTTKQLFE